MYKDFEILPFLLVLFIATSSIVSCTNFMRNITGELFEASGSKINDLFAYQNAQDLNNSTIQNLRDKTNQIKMLADIFETRVDKIVRLLETTSGYPPVRNISYAN